MPETEAQLADWKAKTDAATEGPWEPVDAFSLTAPSQIDGFAFPMERQEDEWEIERNREFIATARTAMPRLMAAVESVLAVCDKADDQMGMSPNWMGLIDPDVIREAITDALGGGDDAE